jgi:four helix bundle protein
MAKLEKYNDLIAWRKAMDLVETLYLASASFPKSEVYGLTSQLRRAAVSIPSNIAEGQCRSTTRSFLQHLSIAQGSAAEVETHDRNAPKLPNSGGGFTTSAQGSGSRQTYSRVVCIARTKGIVEASH